MSRVLGTQDTADRSCRLSLLTVRNMFLEPESRGLGTRREDRGWSCSSEPPGEALHRSILAFGAVFVSRVFKTREKINRINQSRMQTKQVLSPVFQISNTGSEK